MVKVNYDREHNAVIVELEGNVDGAQAKRFFTDFEKLRPKPIKEFKLLVDFSSVDTMDLAVKAEIEKAMDLFNAQGVTEIFRVMPDPNMELGFNLISNSHYSKKVKVHTMRSRQEVLDHLGCRSGILSAGSPAPDFTAPVTPDQKISLRELRGRPVILAFYPADWSPVCGDQMALYNEILPEFRQFKAELLGISVDGPWSHAAFSKDRKFHFPLVADFEPKGEIAKKYGAYRENDGFCERALFVIDKEGIIAWSYCSPVGVNPGADGILQALETLPK